jgi:hypothetical protein
MANMQDFPEDLAFNILIKHKASLIRLAEVLRKQKIDVDIRELPLAYPAEDPTEITVHPNLILNLIRPLDVKGSLSNSNFRSNKPTAFNTLRAIFEADMAHSMKKRKWDHIETVLGRKETTTYARFIRNHLKLAEKGLKDDQIRDIAQKIEYFFKPPELIYANTPSDYTEMFSCDAKTCMSPGSNHYSDVAKELTKLGRSPAEWFHYNPHTQGVYMRKEGTVVARGMLVRTDTTKPFKTFTNIVGSTPEFGKQLATLIKQAGYTSISGGGDFYYYGTVDITTAFEVPAIEHKKKKYCPLPFHDSVRATYCFYYDEDKDVFIYAPLSGAPKDKKSIRNTSPYDFKGFASTDDIESRGKKA